MPLTPSSGMVRHEGEQTYANDKVSAQAGDVEMRDATDTTSTQDGQRARSPFGGSEALSELQPEVEEEEGDEDEAAQYTQPAELWVDYRASFGNCYLIFSTFSQLPA